MPAVVYRDVDAKTIAMQMALLAPADYRTVALETFVRSSEGSTSALPHGPCS
jgi:hypothetical protein